MEGIQSLPRRRHGQRVPIWGHQSDTLRPQDFPGLPENRTFSRSFAGFVLGTTPVRALSLRTLLVRSDAINLVVPTGREPDKARETLLTQDLTIRPSERVQLDTSYILVRLIDDRAGSSVFNNHILRTKGNVQLSRDLSFRVIAQYNGLLANAGYSSLRTTKSLNLSALTFIVGIRSPDPPTTTRAFQAVLSGFCISPSSLRHKASSGLLTPRPPRLRT